MISHAFSTTAAGVFLTAFVPSLAQFCSLIFLSFWFANH
jgi:hypothetical protein